RALGEPVFLHDRGSRLELDDDPRGVRSGRSPRGGDRGRRDETEGGGGHDAPRASGVFEGSHVIRVVTRSTAATGCLSFFGSHVPGSLPARRTAFDSTATV